MNFWAFQSFIAGIVCLIWCFTTTIFSISSRLLSIKLKWVFQSNFRLLLLGHDWTPGTHFTFIFDCFSRGSRCLTLTFNSGAMKEEHIMQYSVCSSFGRSGGFKGVQSIAMHFCIV